MCTGLETALVITAIAGAGTSIYSATQSGKGGGSMPALPAPPEAPDPAKVTDDQRKKQLLAAGLRTKNILTSPVGLTQEPTTRRTLLGGA